MNAHCPHFASDWIEWPGGERPVPALALVDYRLRSGHTITRGAIADDLQWSHGSTPTRARLAPVCSPLSCMTPANLPRYPLHSERLQNGKSPRIT
jgi:hypothetical protein